MAIQSLPTKYKGIMFRSRLESRWAMVLDGLGIPWEYEPEDGKYLLPSGVYWPDFRCFGGTDHAFWLEIKGQMPDSREFHVASEINLYVAPLMILSGDLPRRTNGGTAWWFEPEGKRWIMKSPEDGLIRIMGLHDQIAALEWQGVIDDARRARWDKVTGERTDQS